MKTQARRTVGIVVGGCSVFGPGIGARGKYGGETKASAGRVVGGKQVDWLNGGTPFEATEAYFTVSEASELPEDGEYVADLIFHRVGGSEGGEDLVVHNVTITVSEP